MTITPPPDDSELPQDPADIPNDVPPPTDEPMRAPGSEEVTQPPLRMPSDNPDVETEI